MRSDCDPITCKKSFTRISSCGADGNITRKKKQYKDRLQAHEIRQIP